VESRSWGFSVYLIGYLQDILCKQEKKLLQQLLLALVIRQEAAAVLSL